MAYKLQILNAEVYCSIRIMLCLMICWMSVEDLRLSQSRDRQFNFFPFSARWYVTLENIINCWESSIKLPKDNCWSASDIRGTSHKLLVFLSIMTSLRFFEEIGDLSTGKASFHADFIKLFYDNFLKSLNKNKFRWMWN